MRDIHSVASEKFATSQRKQQAASNHRSANFEVGEFVLWSRINPSALKLTVRWVGPFAIEAVKGHSFLIENILTISLDDVHGSRLKRFSEHLLGVTDELRKHVGNQGLMIGVRSIDDLRYNRVEGAWELKVSWVGLEEEESSWEPLPSMRADVSVLVTQYLNHNAQKPEVLKYRAEHDYHTRESRRYVGSSEKGVLRIVHSATNLVANSCSFKLKGHASGATIHRKQF